MKPAFAKHPLYKLNKPVHTGFTLIEIVIALSIFVLVVGASTALLLTGRTSVSENEARIQAEERARNALNRMTRELQASADNKIWINNDERLHPKNDEGEGDIINFQIPVERANGTIADEDGEFEWGDGSTKDKYIAYSLYASEGNTLNPTLGTTLIRTTYIISTAGNSLSIQDVDDQDLYSPITGLSFESQDDFLTISVTGKGEQGNTIKSKTLETSIDLRN